MLVGPPVPLLLSGFLRQAVFGILAGIGVWRGARSAPLVVVLLGASIAATALVEGFVSIAVALLIAAYVKPDDETTSTHVHRFG